ncbi:hypothetical protein CFC21_082479, partial [Triticum aestivum]
MIRRGMPPPLALLLLLALLGAFAAAQQEGNVPEQYAASLATRFDAPAGWPFPNPRLRAAYAALQAWKQTAIFSDPANFTANWQGPDVCRYNGVYCAPAPSAAYHGAPLTVAGIDLNHADIAGYIPASLPLGLPDLALLHLNSNRFCGVVPDTFRRLRLLHELDLSNNRFVGAFPEVVLALPSLRYLDLRFNDFEGSIPPALFDRPLDAIFLNSNRLRNPIPANLGNSPASVVVLAHNRLGGCIPPSIGRMADTLNEIVLIDDMLTGCVPPQVGLLKKVTVFDVSGNRLQGALPAAVGGMAAVEELDVAGNLFEGAVPAAVCGLAGLKNFTYTDNFITSRPGCAQATADGAWNCIPGAPAQRPAAQCAAAASHPFDCSKAQCQFPAYTPATPTTPGGGKPSSPSYPSPPSSTTTPSSHSPPKGSGTPAYPSPHQGSTTPSYPSPPSSSSTPSYHSPPQGSTTPSPPGSTTPSYPTPPSSSSTPSYHSPPQGSTTPSPPGSTTPSYPTPPSSSSTPSYDAAVQLQHPVIPLAAAEHAGDPVVPVSFVRHPDASRRPRAASPNLGRQARRAVRAASGLVRPHDALRQPPDAVAAHGVPRLRAASPLAGDTSHHHASIRDAPRHPVLAVVGSNNAVHARALRAAVPGRQHRAPDAGRREPAVPAGVRRGIRVAAAANEAVQL